MAGLADRRTLKQLLESGGTLFSITGLPIHGEVVTPDDANDLTTSGYVRADAAGAVTAMPHEGSTSIVVNLLAGEFFPCMVRKVFATGTDGITLHLFY